MKQLECRIIITYWPNRTFDMGMFCPVTMRHEPLGNHPLRDADRIVGALKRRMEQEKHLVTFSERNGPR